MFTFFWEVLDKIGIVTGVLTFFVTIGISLRIQWQHNKLKQIAAKTLHLSEFETLWNYHKDHISENPMALCCSLTNLNQSIKKDVLRFLSINNKAMPIVELNFGNIGQHNIKSFIEQLRIIRSIDLSEASEVHLFIQGPVQAATIIGAMFDNWKPIKLYHYNSSLGSYEYWTYLTK
jgi:hypothetical protein